MLLEAGKRAARVLEVGMGAAWESAAGTRVCCCCGCSSSGNRAGKGAAWVTGSDPRVSCWLLLEEGTRAACVLEAGMGAAWEQQLALGYVAVAVAVPVALGYVAVAVAVPVAPEHRIHVG